MKATELMIGDFVYCKPHKRCAKVYRIDQANGKGNGWIAAIDGDFSEDRYVPIPLQKIHLTKNGFEPVDEDDRVFVFSDGYRIEIVFDDGIPQMSIPPSVYMTIEFAEKELDMPIEYVHQLQQAMRLFEIEKEIEL